MTDLWTVPASLQLGLRFQNRIPHSDQRRQRAEVVEILRRLTCQPGVIVADEVGMGKTFVALATAYCVALQDRSGPVVVMAPANLLDKWVQDLHTFYSFYVDGHRPVRRGSEAKVPARSQLRYGVARHSIEFMQLLDDEARTRCHIVFVAQGAMGRRQSDKWIRLAFIAEALRRHGRGGAKQLIKVKEQIHRFLAELLYAVGEEKAHGWGQELWTRLLKTDPSVWMEEYNRHVTDPRKQLPDDPVPKAILRALKNLDLKELAGALETLPLRAVGGAERVTERIKEVRQRVRTIEEGLWQQALAKAKWRSPLLILDEAHHLKNPGTALARQFQTLTEDLQSVGDGAMGGAFARMLFLTATPFQLGHAELVRVLQRFGDVRWDVRTLGDRKSLVERLQEVSRELDESQRTAIAFHRAWSRLRPEDLPDGLEPAELLTPSASALSHRLRSALGALEAARSARARAEETLRPWIIRHNKGELWKDSAIHRRERYLGSCDEPGTGAEGLRVPPGQLLPFFLAARSAAESHKDLLSEALCSSYEAFRDTRSAKPTDQVRDEDEGTAPVVEDVARSRWYLQQFDASLQQHQGATHPKVSETVRRAVDLWERGEKVLVFAFYRETCSALRRHISRELEDRLHRHGLERLRSAGSPVSSNEALDRLVESIQKRFFDDTDGPGRKAVDAALQAILMGHQEELEAAGVTETEFDEIRSVMRRFLRVPTTILRCFPLATFEKMKPGEAVRDTLYFEDSSGLSWRRKLEQFIRFLASHCSPAERADYLAATGSLQTGGIRVEAEEGGSAGGRKSEVLLANVQVASGTTERAARARLMRAFNTPFFPDILVCSQVMGEGVDLQRYCRHVIHHDLAWNPSTIEQRTGRIDRLGCKAEGRHPISVYLPFLAGMSDERQFRVMDERDRWFRVVMGEDKVQELITDGSVEGLPLPEELAEAFRFNFAVEQDGVGV